MQKYQGNAHGETDTLKVAVTTLEQRDVAMQGTVSSATATIQQLGEALAASTAAPAAAGTDKGPILELKAVQSLDKYNGDRAQFRKWREGLWVAIYGTKRRWREIMDWTEQRKATDTVHTLRAKYDEIQADKGWPEFDTVNEWMHTVLVSKTEG